MKHEWIVNGVRILEGDVLRRLKEMPNRSVHCCVTSPPYFGLRVYSPDLVRMRKYRLAVHMDMELEGVYTNEDGLYRKSSIPERFHHLFVPAEVGQEASSDHYIRRMVRIFREVRRVLRKDGVLWLNMGDSYSSGSRKTQVVQTKRRSNVRDVGHDAASGKHANLNGTASRPPADPAFGNKQLMCIPWRLAIAMKKSGWVLRQDVIWAKNNAMPSSVRDRCTSAHEYVFMFTKSTRYYFDRFAIAEEAVTKVGGALPPIGGDKHVRGHRENSTYSGNTPLTSTTRNARSVWTVNTKPFRDAHFAVMPEELVKRCVLAGSSERGCCASCGSPWRRVVKSVTHHKGNSAKSGRSHVAVAMSGKHAMIDGHKRLKSGPVKVNTTVGWKPTCDCRPRKTVPCVILDPFGGAGTSGLVSANLGRRAVIIELKREYCRIAYDRIRKHYRMREVFVFGSNTEGRHGKGAAKEARKRWGAKPGRARGPMGDSYAIVTKELRPGVSRVRLESIAGEVRRFLKHANDHRGTKFVVTAIGCGLAGFKPKQIAPMFKGHPSNVVLPEAFVSVLRSGR